MLTQAGIQVTVLNSQRTAYGRLADDSAAILKKLEELKTGGAGVSAILYQDGGTTVTRTFRTASESNVTFQVVFGTLTLTLRVCRVRHVTVPASH